MSAKFKAVFVDFSNNFFDRHAIYCLSAYLKSNGIETGYINQKRFSKTIKTSPTLALRVFLRLFLALD